MSLHNSTDETREMQPDIRFVYPYTLQHSIIPQNFAKCGTESNACENQSNLPTFHGD